MHIPFFIAKHNVRIIILNKVMMRTIYRNPPILEVVCEFRLPLNTQWDLTVPGLIFEKIKDKFPEREQRNIHEIEMKQGPQGMRQELRVSERVVLFNRKRNIFVQIGEHLMTVNCLKPYPGWKNFQPNIEVAFRALLDVVDVYKLQRIGLRFINHIEIKKIPVQLEEYFNLRPYMGPDLPQNVAHFLVGCLFLFENKRDACRIQLTPVPAEQAEWSAFRLDLDYYLQEPGAVSAKDALNWVEGAHEQVEKLFEGCITDNLRKLFQEDE